MFSKKDVVKTVWVISGSDKGRDGVDDWGWVDSEDCRDKVTGIAGNYGALIVSVWLVFGSTTG
jgi:hypothetical protein